MVLESPPAATFSNLSLDVIRIGVPFEYRTLITHFVACYCCCVLIAWLALSKSLPAHGKYILRGVMGNNTHQVLDYL